MWLMQRVLCKGLFLFLALSMSGAAGTRALAQTVAAMGFEAVDKDRDGVINPVEWGRFYSELFEGVDTNGDGLATPAELASAFDAFDSDKDGMIEGHEAPLVVILGDKNEDGQVSSGEYGSINWQRNPIDSDVDGIISREEFGDVLREVYSQADLDRNTSLDRSEFNSAPSLTLFRF